MKENENTNTMILEKTIHTLEFHKILERLSHYSTFSATEALILELQPSTDLEEVRMWQNETAEALELLNANTTLSVRGARDVREEAINAQRGVVIEVSVLLDIRYTLRRAGTLRRILERMSAQYPLMAKMVEGLMDCPDLQDSIERSIGDDGEVKDTASAKLAIIRRELKVSFDNLQNKLNRIVNSRTNQTLLQESIITMRGGRYVIPLKAEHKGKIKGIIHDSSSSGVTLFIEPLETVELNNKWREYQIEEEKEIRRILMALTEEVAEYTEDIIRAVEILAYVDFTFSKARFAVDIHAIKPKMVGFQRDPKYPNHPGSVIELENARHPLLGDDAVPLTIGFGEGTVSLVVTGPNTGGKTVALKTVGLMALMAQSGLHLPVSDAKLSVFEGIFADIGDEQSIEQSLSTFSSHLTNIIGILDKCDSHSLVILDEMGAGTDPAEGSALARALLIRLLEKQVTNMVSTHHPELKVFAVETPGARNASMEFNVETLAPTYRLIVGLPGRSNALAIAQRLGLDMEIIEIARSMVATEDLIADDLLDEIQRTREEIGRQNQEITEIKARLSEEYDILRGRLDHIEDERRDILRAARRNAENEIKDFQKEIKSLKREMDKARMPLDTLNALQEATGKVVEATYQPLDEEAIEMPPETDWDPKIGDTVFMDTLNSEGVIVELDIKNATVEVGNLRIKAKLKDLRKRTRSEKRDEVRGRKQYQKSGSTIPPQVKSPGLELDLRGLMVEEAIEKLDRYIDAAYTSGLPFGRIIHGKGTGRLRQAVREFTDGHPLISKITAAEANEGGSGVTIIHMVPTI
ncbi:endonuclease MutS2 [Anaerolineales bacterium]